jgi:hypothetical protein
MAHTKLGLKVLESEDFGVIRQKWGALAKF